MKVVFGALFLLFVAVVYSQNLAEVPYPGEEEEPYFYDPFFEFNSFEGSYTSDSFYGTLGLHICVDRYGQLSGSYDEIGLLQGFVRPWPVQSPENMTASGNFYEPGTGNCVVGVFNITLTTNGFTGTWNCLGIDEKYDFSEIRTNSYRPTDEDCAVLDRVGTRTIEGRWEDHSGQLISACLTDTALRASFNREIVNDDYDSVIADGFVEGSNLLNGKIASGTWYERGRAGPIIYFVRSDGTLGAYRWSGLLGRRGRTVIDPSQYRQEEKHQVYQWEFWGNSTGAQCNENRNVKTRVLTNLPNDDDDNYFFINSDIFDALVDPQYYLGGIESGASSLALCVLVVIGAIALQF